MDEINSGLPRVETSHQQLYFEPAEDLTNWHRHINTSYTLPRFQPKAEPEPPKMIIFKRLRDEQSPGEVIPAVVAEEQGPVPMELDPVEAPKEVKSVKRATVSEQTSDVNPAVLKAARTVGPMGGLAVVNFFEDMEQIRTDRLNPKSELFKNPGAVIERLKSLCQPVDTGKYKGWRLFIDVRDGQQYDLWVSVEKYTSTCFTLRTKDFFNYVRIYERSASIPDAADGKVIPLVNIRFDAACHHAEWVSINAGEFTNGKESKKLAKAVSHALGLVQADLVDAAAVPSIGYDEGIPLRVLQSLVYGPSKSCYYASEGFELVKTDGPVTLKATGIGGKLLTVTQTRTGHRDAVRDLRNTQVRDLYKQHLDEVPKTQQKLQAIYERYRTQGNLTPVDTTSLRLHELTERIKTARDKAAPGSEQQRIASQDLSCLLLEVVPYYADADDPVRVRKKIGDAWQTVMHDVLYRASFEE